MAGTRVGPLGVGDVAEVGAAARLYAWTGVVSEDGGLVVTWAGGWGFDEAGPPQPGALRRAMSTVPPDELGQLVAALRTVRAGGRPGPVEAHQVLADGRPVTTRLWLRAGSGEGAVAAVGQLLAVGDEETPKAAVEATTRLLEVWQESGDQAGQVMASAVQGFLAAWSTHPGEDQTVRTATRRDLASDLHDGPLQLQHLLMAQLDGALEIAASGGDPVEMIRQMRYTARRAVDELRVVVGELDPHAGRTADVAAELARVVRVWLEDGATIGEVPVTDVDIDPFEAPETTAVAMRRVLAEALNNIGKHARAGRVGVRLEVDEVRATLTVTDDGVGFDATARPVRLGEQRGVAGMRNRLGALGGGVDVTSSADDGSTIVAWVPR